MHVCVLFVFLLIQYEFGGIVGFENHYFIQKYFSARPPPDFPKRRLNHYMSSEMFIFSSLLPRSLLHLFQFKKMIEHVIHNRNYT